MSKKEYKCKYCSFHGTKEQLVSHTESDHTDMIPKNYTAARLVFNNIYKKDHGTCVVCKRETQWNEDTWRYNRLCGRKVCKDTLRKNYEKNMIRVYKTTTLLNDPEQQEMMLSHRSISGEYKFKDGGVRTYTGSYEKKTLEFFDKVMNVHSDDIITPGPVLEYEFEGNTLKWITDILYVPANLIIEVKDGGSNPNNRQMDSYRAKQIAKEKMITELGTYNYLRLTNNNFEQLLFVLAELKSQMIDDTMENKKAVISINEEVGGMPASTPFQRDEDSVYIINYGYNSVFVDNDDTEGYGFTTSLESDKILVVDENSHVVSVPREFLENKNFDIYKYSGKDIKDKCKKVNKALKENKEVDKYYFYELFTGKEVYTEDQIEKDNKLENVAIESSDIIRDIIGYSMIAEANKVFDNNYCLPVLYPGLNHQINKKLKLYRNMKIMEDAEGFFVVREDACFRTKSYNSISEIPDEAVKILSTFSL